MLSVKEILSLTGVASPVLTAYIASEQMNKATGKSVPIDVRWLRKEAETLAKNLDAADAKNFRRQLSRTEKVLTEQPPKAKGIVILAGPKTWTLFPLPLKVENELHWGKPAVAQLLSLVEEEKPCLVAAIDRVGARFFRYELGEINEYEESKFHVDASQWKKKEHAHMAQPGTEMPHGNQRDVFKQRMDAQYLHFCREIAKRIEALSKRERLHSIFLVGSKRLAEPIEAAFPNDLRKNVVLVAEDLARAPKGIFKKRIGSVIAARAQLYPSSLVDQLLTGEHSTVLGLDETLAQLQNGCISTVIVARGFDKTIKQCAKCGLVNRSADPVCPSCGSGRMAVKLSDVLPELLQTHCTNIEIVNGAAGERLTKACGIGGWLRQSRRAE
jgi:hypothetical protein